MAIPLQALYDELRVAEGPSRAKAHAASREDPFILKLAHLVLSHGVQIRASDIHLEPTARGARVRYRIDGLLHEMLMLPEEIRDPLLRAIKVQANMATDAVGRSKPQDGRIDFADGGRTLDLRLSSFPTLYGDVLAIRLLDRSSAALALDQVGFAPALLEAFGRLIRRPNGMLLVTGPAGSGKTTTLYAALNHIRAPHIKIVTLEDPVEYQVDEIDQAQVNPAAGLTFASGLRAILRQDANVILVGEIRDKETAEIAVRAALTGHLVLSTMHTRNAAGTMSRLIDMGIEPHLIAASVIGVVAQRLVRLVCPGCAAHDPRAAEPFTALWRQETGKAPPPEHLVGLRRGAGCTACSQTGYKGRSGIFEFLVIDEGSARRMLDRADGPLFAPAGPAGGFQSMRAHGLEKAACGLTTVTEVLRVGGETEERSPEPPAFADA